MLSLLPETMMDNDPTLALFCYLATMLGSRFIHADMPLGFIQFFDSNVVKFVVLQCMFYLFFRRVVPALLFGTVSWIIIKHIGGSPEKQVDHGVGKDLDD